MSESLCPHERIRKRNDFNVIYRKGRRYRGKYLNFVYLSNDLGYSRLGVVAGKKVGNAVRRNQVKRWLKALFRRNKALLKETRDLVIIATSKSQDATWNILQEEFLRAMEKIAENHD